jgi:PAS domain S-box-containing protein
MRHRNGSPIPISVSSSPINDPGGGLVGAVETIRSLSEEERLVEILARETSRNRAILDSLAEGVVTVDHRWKITSMNATAGRMLGTAPPDALGRMCSETLCGDRCGDGCPLVHTLKEGRPVRDELVNLTRTGGRPLEVSLNTAVLRDRDGEAMGGVLSFREFTEVERLKSELAGEHHFQGIIGKSPAMRAVFGLIKEIAASHSTVLITGESGTGKEMVADAVQQLSARRGKPYVKVNCAVLSDGILESELFGHEKGAFTDAHHTRRGRFELADGGTLFLDEIGDISHNIQIKLLRVLQERRFERVGGEASLDVDVRFIAATHRGLEELVEAGTFREDLFYRLNVIPLHLPPLRERREDIPLLVDHFLRKYSLVTGKDVRAIQGRALDMLLAGEWPGNVRQLENAVEYAFARARGNTLTASILPPDVQRRGARKGVRKREGEGDRVREALERNQWHHGRAAHDLGISRTTLWRRMRRLNLAG